MKVAVFIVCLILSTGIGWSQVKPVVNLGYGALLKEYRFQEFQLGGGVQLNDHFSLQLNYRYMYYEFDLHPSREPMKADVISFSTGYRVLKGNHIISPIVVLDIGTPLRSNANNTLMHHYFQIEEEYYTGMIMYNRGLVFGKLKTMCDLKLKSFDFLIGGSYNPYVFSMTNLKSSSWTPTPEGYVLDKKYRFVMNNFGIEASLMYTIPSKKEK